MPNRVYPGSAACLVVTEHAELENDGIDQGVAVQELLIDAHRVGRLVVRGEREQEQQVAFEVELELIEDAPHRLLVADRDERELAAEQGAAHRRQLAVAGKVLAGG